MEFPDFRVSGVAGTRGWIGVKCALARVGRVRYFVWTVVRWCTSGRGFEVLW